MSLILLSVFGWLLLMLVCCLVCFVIFFSIVSPCSYCEPKFLGTLSEKFFDSLKRVPLEIYFHFCQMPWGNTAHDYFNQVFRIYWQNKFWHQICLWVNMWFGISGDTFYFFLFFPLHPKTGQHPHFLPLPGRMYHIQSHKNVHVYANKLLNLRETG